MAGFERFPFVARFVAESALFGIMALGVTWIGFKCFGDEVVLLVAATFFITAILPMPWPRSIREVAIGAFVASLIFFGWLSWWIVIFGVREWSELPSKLFNWQNIELASILCAAAAAGRALKALVPKK